MTGEQRKPILSVHEISHRFDDGRPGLDGVSLAVFPGELMIVAGRNGSGKTTLFKHLNGLLIPHTGEVRVDGWSTARHPLEVRRRVGLVFQDADLQIVGETVAADVAFGPENLRLSPKSIRQRVAAALEAVGLTALADQPPHRLSGGEKRRLAIAGVLAMAPAVLVLDEPFSNLDWPGARQVLAQILALHRAGHTILVSTHDIEKIIAHGTRMIVLDAGRVVLDGPPETLLPHTEAYGIRTPCAARMGRPIPSWLS